MKAVYSPCVEPLQYMFDSKARTLAPDSISVFDDEAEAKHVVNLFGRFGVGYIARGKGESSLKKIAKAEWEAGNKKWAEAVVLDWHKTTKDEREAGLAPDEPPAVTTAKEYLRVLVVAVALLFPAFAFAQDSQPGVLKSGNFAYNYDLETSTLTYCVVEGENNDPFGNSINGAGQIETSGSSITVTGVNAADDVFAVVDIGDVLNVRRSNGNVEVLTVVTNADDDTITVADAVDLTGGFTWRYKKTVCGTAVTDGWISVSGYTNINLGIQYDAGDLGALEVVWECLSGAPGAQPVQVYPGPASDCGFGTLSTSVCSFASTGDRFTRGLANNAFAFCRIGIRDDGTDNAVREEIYGTIDVGR
ncbi:MAG: hypothetical protein GY906_24880 [bacterium]|nr:hypothetical protein [bacterium]